MQHHDHARLLLLVVAVATLARCAAAAAIVQQSLDGGASFAAAGRIQLVEDETGVHGLFEREPGSLDAGALAALVRSNGRYMLRVTLEQQAPVLTSINAACLATALAAPELSLQLDSEGHIISAGLAVPAGAVHDGGCSVAAGLVALQALPASVLAAPPDMHVAVGAPTPAPAVPQAPAAAVPDLMAAGTAAQQQHQQQQQAAAARQRQQQRQHGAAAGGAGQQGGGEAGEGGGGEGEQQPPPRDERTWLQKNWLFVMAGATMVVNMLLRSLVDPNAPGGPPGAARGPPRRMPVPAAQ